MAFLRDEKTNKVIDPERNAVLRGIQGFTSGFSDWEIQWSEGTIGFRAKDKTKYGGENGKTPIAVDWFIASVKIPESLKARRAEAFAMIEDSLKGYGSGLIGYRVKTTVEFDPQLIR